MIDSSLIDLSPAQASSRAAKSYSSFKPQSHGCESVVVAAWTAGMDSWSGMNSWHVLLSQPWALQAKAYITRMWPFWLIKGWHSQAGPQTLDGWHRYLDLGLCKFLLFSLDGSATLQGKLVFRRPFRVS